MSQEMSSVKRRAESPLFQGSSVYLLLFLVTSATGLICQRIKWVDTLMETLSLAQRS